MVHYVLIDVLLRIRLYRILTADVNWMYRAITLVESDKDHHCYVWRTSPHDSVKDFCMTKHQAENFHLLPRQLTMLPTLMTGSLEPTQW